MSKDNMFNLTIDEIATMTDNEIGLEYYAIKVDSNTKEVKQFNIFNNVNVSRGAIEAVVQYLTSAINYDEYLEKLRIIIMSEMWARVQYEISVGKAFETNIENLQKIDVFYQVEKNLPVIAMYVYMKAKEYFYDEDVMDINEDNMITKREVKEISDESVAYNVARLGIMGERK